MRLSGEEGTPSSNGGLSNTLEMRQTNQGLVDPLITRPQVYYGEGPFDPQSSDDEDDLVVRHSAETESISLLSGGRIPPSSPGRAERAEQSPRPHPEARLVSRLLRVIGAFCRTVQSPSPPHLYLFLSVLMC